MSKNKIPPALLKVVEEGYTCFEFSRENYDILLRYFRDGGWTFSLYAQHHTPQNPMKLFVVHRTLEVHCGGLSIRETVTDLKSLLMPVLDIEMIK